jgi:quercetin dioxygenase-like cupin family protein
VVAFTRWVGGRAVPSIDASYATIIALLAETREGAFMSDLIDLSSLPLIEVWGEEVRSRRVDGERITLSVLELGPGAVVPGHQHPHEQIGLCIEGSLTFRVGDEMRELGPGGIWRIRSGIWHQATAGATGAVVIDVFNPTRTDWDFPIIEPRRPVWPAAEGDGA